MLLDHIYLQSPKMAERTATIASTYGFWGVPTQVWMTAGSGEYQALIQFVRGADHSRHFPGVQN